MSRVDCPTWLHSQALNHGVTLLRAAEKHGPEYVVGKRRSVPQQVWPMRRVAEGEDGRLARSQMGRCRRALSLSITKQSICAVRSGNWRAGALRGRGN